MTVLLGMLVGALIAGMAFFVGYGAGIATVPHEPESHGDAVASEPLRAESIARLTPTIPPPMTGKEIAAAFTDTLNTRRLQTLGPNGSLADALETYTH
jgi:hypothetical protein